MSNGQAERFVDTFKRACRKLKKEGAQNVVNTFLTSYRTMPNDSLPNGKSPAELFLQRKPRTTLDLLRAKPTAPLIRDEAMEKQFNRRFGAKARKFCLGDKVFVRHRQSQSWRAGIVSKCQGVIYEVSFPNGTLNRFHANQMTARHTDDDHGNEELNIFNDAFGLPLAPTDGPNEAALPADQQATRAQETDGANVERSHVRVDRPQRNRRPPQRYSPS
ncbi:hypothetical protein niasHS_008741 [Heterodera schachtii]|uniref:Integrase catalytic domain-containing protein n=1 Tax=Heterodera schachtii TaxID=97005 RepID=A0ABD2IYB2_HETSC